VGFIPVSEIFNLFSLFQWRRGTGCANTAYLAGLDNTDNP